MWSHSCTFTGPVLLFLYWPYVGRPLCIPFLPLVSTSPQIRSKVNQKKRREKGGGVVVVVEVVGRECPLFSLHVVLVLFSEVVVQGGRESRGRERTGGCFPFSELRGHVGALTCNASWVINPSRWMCHWLAHGQDFSRSSLETQCYWVTK